MISLKFKQEAASRLPLPCVLELVELGGTTPTKNIYLNQLLIQIYSVTCPQICPHIIWRSWGNKTDVPLQDIVAEIVASFL